MSGTRSNGLHRPKGAGRFLSIATLFVALALRSGAAETNVFESTNVVFAPFAPAEPVPENSRECFNAGTRKLRDGKLPEAEALLQAALAKQDARVQPSALYNLGHVRFTQGADILKKSPEGKAASAGGATAARAALQANDEGRDALAAEEMQKMVAAYQKGRGARRNLRAATDAIDRALQMHGATLRKWQRALGDFQSAAELNPADTNAVRNAEAAALAIARLIDALRELQQTAQAMGSARQQLSDTLRQLRGKIPSPLMPPGDGDEEEEEDSGTGKGSLPPELRAGQEEGPVKEGAEMTLSPEAARWLLESFNLDSNRRLPMGMGPQGPNAARKRKEW